MGRQLKDRGLAQVISLDEERARRAEGIVIGKDRVRVFAGNTKSKGFRDEYSKIARKLADAPACAAWLVRQHRARLHLAGEVVFRLPPKGKLPPWFEVALEFLETRSGHWKVTRLATRPDGVRQFVVQWLKWRTHAR